MPRDDRSTLLERSLKAVRVPGAGDAAPAMMASYTLIGAIVMLGGLGYAIDAWRGTSPWGVLAGLLLGMAVGFYELAKTVWKR